MSIKTLITEYLDARDNASKWADARFTDDANRQERERLTKPARDALSDGIIDARGADADRRAYAEAVANALRDDSDTNRVLARELAWQRLLRRVERGEPIDLIAHDASPVELEALAAFAPTELPHVRGNANLDKSPAQWRAHVEEAVVDAYTGHPANAERFAPLAEKAQEAEATLALAELGTALIKEDTLNGALRNKVYRIDQELYSRVTGG